jgi:molybdopterin converting factor small subunit
MMISLQLPADRQSISLEARTVGQAVEVLCSRNGQLRERLLRSNGTLRPSFAVFINNSRPAAGPETELKDGDTLVLVQAVGGG